MTIDELWEKYYLADEDWGHFVRHEAFIAALTEYGEHIKAEAVKVVEKVPKCGNWATEGLDNHAKVTGWHQHSTVRRRRYCEDGD